LGDWLVADARQRSAAYLMIVMAIGQALLLISFAWIASASALRPGDYRTKVELPLWFAILPTAVAISVGIHMFFSRHVDRTCPWVSLGWLVLAANIGALMMYMLMTS
jgi:hypothetical protein